MTSKPSHTNCPSSLPRALTSGFTAGSCIFVFGFSCSFSSCHPHRHCSCCACSFAYRHISGGYSRGVPPLPIPNRAVKPARADGTAPQCGRVGRRRFSETSKINVFGVSLFYMVNTQRSIVNSQRSTVTVLHPDRFFILIFISCISLAFYPFEKLNPLFHYHIFGIPL